jgi:hypothetical protein
MIKLIAIIVIGLALFYSIALAALYWLQGRLVYPLEQIQSLINPTFDARTEAVTVTTKDGLELTGRYRAPPDEAAPLIILFHGNGEDITQRAHIALELIDAGYGVLLAEYRGLRAIRASRTKRACMPMRSRFMPSPPRVHRFSSCMVTRSVQAWPCNSPPSHMSMR